MQEHLETKCANAVEFLGILGLCPHQMMLHNSPSQIQLYPVSIAAVVATSLELTTSMFCVETVLGQALYNDTVIYTAHKKSSTALFP